MKKNYQEAEIKLQLTESVYTNLKKQYAAEYPGVLQKNYFFDTPDNYLLHNKWVIRIRIEDNKKGYITVKGQGEKEKAFHQRPEYESIIPTDNALTLLNGFHLNSIDFLPCNELVKRFGDQHVRPFLSFINIRISFPWKEWEFELDKTTIEEKIFYELEVEIDPGEQMRVEKELKNLFGSHRWAYIPSPMSKFKRALSLIFKVS